MLWHAGDVVSAVSEVKKSGATFIVYIHGEDGDSAKMNTVWESALIAQALEGNSIVALKLAQNSPGCNQFNQIYPVVCIPSTFFIGDEGVPLEVIPGYCEEADLAHKIHRAFQLHREQRKAATGSQQQTASSSRVDEQMASAAVSESRATAAAAAAADASNASAETDDGSGGAEAAGTNEDISERLRRAQELISRKQVERLQQQIEERRQKEAERRELGKGMARLKQMQAEQSILEGAAEMRKDKEDEKIARQKVREQIAKDRADRAERYQKEKDGRHQQAEQLAQEQLATQEQERARLAAARSPERDLINLKVSQLSSGSNVARIQFRLPDGSSVTNQFEPSDSLETARQYLALHSPTPLGRDFRLSTPYPRRIFSTADMQSTLADLALAPSAVLVVLPPLSRDSASFAQHSSAAQQPIKRVTEGAWSIVQLLLSPLLVLWNFIYTFLFGTAATQGGQHRRAAGNPGQASAATDQQRRQMPGQRPTVRDGNIARLSTLEDPDDPNATWNGNSTQQK